MVKSGACVIDVGITRLYDRSSNKTRLVGDVEFDGLCTSLYKYFQFSSVLFNMKCI